MKDIHGLLVVGVYKDTSYRELECYKPHTNIKTWVLSGKRFQNTVSSENLEPETGKNNFILFDPVPCSYFV